MNAVRDDYTEFLRAKVAEAPSYGFEVAADAINPIMKPHAAAIVRWLVAGGRRACFASFGLHKTMIQIEAVRIARQHAGGMGLIVLPLGVRGEFMRDAAILRTGDHPKITDAQRAQLAAWLGGHPERAEHLTFIRRIDEAADPEGLYLTNYESVRDRKLDTSRFSVVSLDEGSVLRGFGGTKTFRNFMAILAGDDRQAGVKTDGIRYRFVATATPDPNAHIELLAYSAFLGVGDVGQMKTRFFKRNSEKADQLTLHPHKEAEFYAWLSTWAVFMDRPSDLGFSDDGYALPPLNVAWHELPVDHKDAGSEKDGQARLFRNAVFGVQEAAREKRESIAARVAKLMEIVAAEPADQIVIWCDLNDEQRAIERALTDAGITVASLYGNQDMETREALMEVWRGRERRVFLSKPTMYGAGVNLQQSHTMIFAGIGFKAQDFMQAIHRIYRFLQEHLCTVHILYTEAERDVRARLEHKWEQHKAMVATMTDLIREHGLDHGATMKLLERSIGVKRIEASGERYTCVNNDCVEEARAMPDNCVDLIVTSIPFGTQYEYSASYNDFGHTDDTAHFWRQMDFLVPELLRILRPGRVAAIHVKDRITPGGINGFGFQTLTRFSDQCADNFEKHGWAFLGRKTIVTDVVRENNQTYRLGWTEQCKDGSRMGCGTPEYLLIFRKAPTDNSNGYADVPAVKDKTAFTRPRWQFDAHGFMRSSGNRLLTPEELEGLTQAQIFRAFKKHSLESVYDFRHDIRIAEHVDKSGWLPSTFMLLQPQSWHPDVLTDVVRMRSLNTAQASKGKEQHICPLPLDLVERCVEQYSMPDEIVLDPFGGLMTVPYCAVKLCRKGVGIELSHSYFLDGCAYCAAAEREMSMPDLFDALDADQAA